MKVVCLDPKPFPPIYVFSALTMFCSHSVSLQHRGCLKHLPPTAGGSGPGGRALWEVTSQPEPQPKPQTQTQTQAQAQASRRPEMPRNKSSPLHEHDTCEGIVHDCVCCDRFSLPKSTFFDWPPPFRPMGQGPIEGLARAPHTSGLCCGVGSKPRDSTACCWFGCSSK